MKYVLSVVLLLAAPALHAQWSDVADDDEQSAWLEQQAAATEAYHARIAAAMATSKDVREQAFAEVLRRPAAMPGNPVPGGDAPSRPAPRDAGAEARLRALTTRAGDDRLANQLLIAAIADPASRMRIEAARRWQAAEAGNVIPLFHSALSPDALLVEARRATFARTHMYDAVRWMASAYLRHPLSSTELAALSGGEAYDAEEAATMAAMALWASGATPTHHRLVDACRGNGLRATPTRAADCRHLATLLVEESDSVLDRMVGLSMLRELAGDNAERAAIDAQRRTMDWQMLQWGRIAQQQPRDGAEQFVRLLRDESIQGERQLAERVLQEAGVPLTPPAGWSPPRY